MGSNFRRDVPAALAEAKQQNKPILFDFSAAPMWGACARLDAEVWPDEQVSRVVNEDYVAVRVNAREQPEEFRRYGEEYGAQWTPTVLMLDPSGTERRRVEGFLPADDLLAELKLGLAQVSFARGEYEVARRQSQQVVAQLGDAAAAPEALYWSGVARYKATNDPAALGETAKAFTERYQDSAWAKKASVWGT